MTQESLAAALGLTFQQVQKYEAGANRVGASRLSAMADTLDVPIPYFFADAPAVGEKISAGDKLRREWLEKAETIELVRLYYAVPAAAVRHQFLKLVKAVAKSVETEG